MDGDPKRIVVASCGWDGHFAIGGGAKSCEVHGMAWIVNGTDLRMSEKDFGVALPVTLSGTTLGASDTLRFTFKDAVNGETILTKEYTPTNNTVQLEFTEAESDLFAPGAYVYSLDWYQNGAFMYNIVEVGAFKVGDKA